MANSVLFKSVNQRTLVMGFSTVLFGTAAATVVGNEEFLPAFLCVLFALFFQMAFNLRHRYHDFIYGFGESVNDELEQNNSSNIPTRVVLREGSTASFIVALTIGLGILSFAGWWVLVLGLLLGLLAWINYLGSHQLTRTPFGLLVTFLLFGPVGVIGTMMVQIMSGFNNGSVSIHHITLYEVLPSFFFGVIAGLMAVNCHLAFSAETVENDTLNGKKTFTVKYGEIGAEMLYILDGILILTLFIVMQLIGELAHRWFVLIVPIIVSLSYFVIWKKVHGKIGLKGYRLLENYTLGAMLVTAIWVLLFYVIFGVPDKSDVLYFGYHFALI
ncbi:MAG: prenyltransferase [Bacteroidales bacterium]|nr:prenyltransferase [Bacteroidales bacterium]MBD5209392.1 prenyltransferase [Bacteroidales bacterium]